MRFALKPDGITYLTSNLQRRLCLIILQLIRKGKRKFLINACAPYRFSSQNSDGKKDYTSSKRDVRGHL
ncbi:unnamed protein product [Cylicocyclus nassatus]|uniref:Uncharacterized protein n=1 Tax=Cylicocyclus nassatus TaxID=53992 RepID=A0AA36GVC4_CYLNA|nr:unnamed protein product [Cylicocyclus nassatus]